MPPPLEPDRATAEAWLERFSRFALDHLDALETAPSVGPVGSAGLDVADEVSTAIPEAPHPGGLGDVLQRLERATAASLNTPGPGYFAYIPGSGLWASALADLVAGSINRFTGHSVAAPALCRLESDVLTWLANEFGYGPEARGLFTSGGSIANLSAFATARDHVLPRDGDFRHALAYASNQAHHSVDKGLRLIGIPAANLRRVRVDERCRIRVDRLARQVRQDRADGKRPFLVVASAGTTNTGAVDPLGPLADFCAAEGLWLHVDAAYGGAFVLCPEGRSALNGIERADSITFDPHKGLFLPFGTGCLLVRDGRRLRDTHAGQGAYLQDFDRLDRRRETPSPTMHGPELSRSFRGLRLWLPLMLHGAAAFRATLAEKLQLAQTFHRALEQRIAAGAPLEIVDAPQLSIVTFRQPRHDGEALVDWNARNTALNNGINAGGRAYLSSTQLPAGDGDAFTLRVCVLGVRTHARHVAALLEDLDAALQRSKARTRE